MGEKHSTFIIGVAFDSQTRKSCFPISSYQTALKTRIYDMQDTSKFEHVPDAEILYPTSKFKAEFSKHLYGENRKLKKWEPNVHE